MSKSQEFWDNVVMGRSREFESQPESFRRDTGNLVKFNADIAKLHADYNKLKQQEDDVAKGGIFEGEGEDAKEKFLGQIKGG